MRTHGPDRVGLGPQGTGDGIRRGQRCGRILAVSRIGLAGRQRTSACAGGWRVRASSYRVRRSAAPLSPHPAGARLIGRHSAHVAGPPRPRAAAHALATGAACGDRDGPCTGRASWHFAPAVARNSAGCCSRVTIPFERCSTPPVPRQIPLCDSRAEAGASGARLTGAGWGGVVVVLAPERSGDAIVRRIQESFAREFGRVPRSWKTVASGGVRGTQV